MDIDVESCSGLKLQKKMRRKKARDGGFYLLACLFDMKKQGEKNKCQDMMNAMLYQFTPGSKQQEYQICGSNLIDGWMEG
jgi:hypothetical protein